jgi:hypothetical protein
MRQSFVAFDKYIVAASCVLLGSKVEETPKKISNLTCEYIFLRKNIEKDQVFAIQKHDPEKIAGTIISMESLVMHTLAYELTLVHPYTFINEKVDKVVKLQTNFNEEEVRVLSGKMKQVAWSFLNDSAYTCACLRAEAHDLAAGAVYLAGLYENYIPFSLETKEKKPWWSVLKTSFSLLQEVATFLLEAYMEPYIETEKLPKSLSILVYHFHPECLVKVNTKQQEQQIQKKRTKEEDVLEVEEEEQLQMKTTSQIASTLTSTPCTGTSNSRPKVLSPMNPVVQYVTSPECGSSQGRSPCDTHELEAELKSSSRKQHVVATSPFSQPATAYHALEASPGDVVIMAEECSSLNSRKRNTTALNGFEYSTSSSLSSSPLSSLSSSKKLKYYE